MELSYDCLPQQKWGLLPRNFVQRHEKSHLDPPGTDRLHLSLLVHRPEGRWLLSVATSIPRAETKKGGDRSKLRARIKLLLHHHLPSFLISQVFQVEISLHNTKIAVMPGQSGACKKLPLSARRARIHSALRFGIPGSCFQ